MQHVSSDTHTHTPITFRRLIGTGISAKLLIDIGQQIFNPFLPVIAAGLGIDVITLGRLVGLRSFMGIFAPAAGVAADRWSYRLVIRLGLLLNAGGFLLIGFSQTSWMTVAGMILAGLGTGMFVPTLQAYVSSHLDYSIRARGLGMIEYSWALTGIVGLSVVGVLIELTSWRMPFLLLAGGMIVMSFVFTTMPPGRSGHAPPSPAAAAARWSPLVFFRIAQNARSTYATILAGGLCYFAAMQIIIAHGAWLEQQYGLTPAQLGLVAFVFGWFDLAASVSVSLFTDRIGKRRSVLLGMGCSFLAYGVLPFFNTAVTPVVLAIAVARMFFEFSIVSYFPLLSEQAPLQRGKVMAFGAAVALVGGTVAGFTGPWLLVNLGVPGLSWLSAATVAVAFAVVLLLVRE